jgi:hypothetical protein
MGRPVSATLAGALRRQLLARGCTPRPTCPQCGLQTDPKSFSGRGICQRCEVVVQAEEREAELADVRAAAYGYGLHVDYPEDARWPTDAFLPADDHV